MQPIQRRAPTLSATQPLGGSGRRRCLLPVGSWRATARPSCLARSAGAPAPCDGLALGQAMTSSSATRMRISAPGCIEAQVRERALHGLVSLLEHQSFEPPPPPPQAARTRLGVVGDLHHVDTETRADDMPTLARPQRQHAVGESRQIGSRVGAGSDAQSGCRVRRGHPGRCASLSPLLRLRRSAAASPEKKC